MIVLALPDIQGRLQGVRLPAASFKEHVARKAFGDEFVRHYARVARAELAAFANDVTDWERRRAFESL